ncbi:hypothetical protein ACGK9U_06610 [Mariniflexile sp. HNIBRBA6329]|uniref:hypothetical protein n=1 Tax=Mariniflexile sp. HNIBRBA6329 TaxID=3373088 RepID=UPI0037466614
MKNSILLTLALLIFVNVNSQETYFTQFCVKESLKTKLGNTISLSKDVEVDFTELPDDKKNEYIALIEKNRGGELTVDKKIGTLTIKDIIKIPSTGVIDYNELLKGIKFTVTKNVSLNNTKRKSFVKFDKDKVIVNPWLTNDKDGKVERDIYYYKLENRQVIYLNFQEVSLSGITIPIKYRFKEGDDLKEQFSTSFNANLFLGWTFYGKRSFFYRDGVDNKSNIFKATLGGFLGAATVKLNNSNTSLADEPIAEGTEITEGLASLGIGINLSFNKFNFGVFTGWDYSVGENSDKWNYNKKTWLGLSLGYTLLKI